MIDIRDLQFYLAEMLVLPFDNRLFPGILSYQLKI